MKQQGIFKMARLLASLLLTAMLLPKTVVGFVPMMPIFSRHSFTRIHSTASEEPVDVTDTDTLFPGATVLEFSLKQHKPLGCTVEESLAHPAEKHIFISKVCW